MLWVQVLLVCYHLIDLKFCLFFFKSLKIQNNDFSFLLCYMTCTLSNAKALENVKPTKKCQAFLIMNHHFFRDETNTFLRSDNYKLNKNWLENGKGQNALTSLKHLEISQRKFNFVLSLFRGKNLICRKWLVMKKWITLEM